MSPRVPIAVLAGLAGVTAYIAAAVAIGDAVTDAHWLAQAVYFAVVGSVWVIPVRWLMYWAAGLR